MKTDNPYGDDAGTRVGRPDTPKRDNLDGNPDGNLHGNSDGDLHGSGDGGDLGAGKESTGGLSKHGNPAQDERPGSVPPERSAESDSSYGGNKGGPKQPGDRR